MNNDQQSVSQLIDRLETAMGSIESSAGFLSDRQTELQSYIAGCPFPAWFKDVDSKILYVNLACEVLFGYTPKDYVEHDSRALWPNVMIDAAIVTDQECIKTKRPVFWDNTAVHPKTGERIFMHMIKWPLFTNSEVVGVGGLVLSHHTIPEDTPHITTAQE